MAFHPLSFLVGLGAAAALPLLMKAVRPVAIQLTVTGMELVEEARRVLAEQMEVMEDIAAEARARRDEAAAEPAAESENGGEEVSERPARRLRRQRSG